MKILHVVPSYLPAYRYGGPIRSVHGLARAQVEGGDDVHVFTTNVDGPGVSPVAVGVPVGVEGVKVWYFSTSFGRRVYRAPAMAAALRRGAVVPDVVHLHSVFLWPTMMAARWATSADIPYVVSPRGMLVNDLVRRKSRPLKLAWISLFERRTIAEAAAVHLTSEVERDEFEAFGLRAKKVVVIPNAVDTRARASHDAAGGQAPYVLFLGRLNWKKGLDRLISAMAQLPQLKLIVAGNDEENYRRELDRLVEQHGLANRVEFIGEVYDEKKWDLLRGAVLLAAPSYNENFGIVVLEAMSVGCPVLVTPEVGLAGEVQASGAGLVVPGNPEAIAVAIVGLLGRPQERDAMGEKGRAVAAKYTWPSIAQRMDLVYAHAIAVNRGPAVPMER